MYLCLYYYYECYDEGNVNYYVYCYDYGYGYDYVRVI